MRHWMLIASAIRDPRSGIHLTRAVKKFEQSLLRSVQIDDQ
jgi:hypothetical protein